MMLTSKHTKLIKSYFPLKGKVTFQKLAWSEASFLEAKLELIRRRDWGLLAEPLVYLTMAKLLTPPTTGEAEIPTDHDLPRGWTGRSVFLVDREYTRESGTDQRRQRVALANAKGRAKVSWSDECDEDSSIWYEGYLPRGRSGRMTSGIDRWNTDIV